MNKKSAKTNRSKPTKEDKDSSYTNEFLLEHVKTLSTKKKQSRVIDLAAAGPVRLIKTSKGRGLLIHHGCGDDGITLQSLTTGEGFSLSKDAARDLAGLLLEWAGTEAPNAISQWSRYLDTRKVTHNGQKV